MTDIVFWDDIGATLPDSSGKRIGILDKEEIKKQFLERYALESNKRGINPYGYHLAQFEWAVFGGLTWRCDAVASANQWANEIRVNDFYRLIAMACTRHRLRPSRLLFYGKSEWGFDKRAHFHYAIGARGLEGVNIEDFCKTMMDLWTVEMNRGTAQIEPYDWQQHLDGILYQSKMQFDSTGLDVCIDEVFSKKLRSRMRQNASFPEWENN